MLLQITKVKTIKRTILL